MVSLESKALQYVFGKEYSSMLRTLVMFNILHSDNFYLLGEKCYTYGFYNTIKFTYTLEYSFYLKKYADKMKEYLNTYRTKQELENKKQLNDDLLYNRYNEALQHLKMPYIDEANKFVSLHHFNSDYSFLYYTHIIDKYKENDFNITQVDKNKRIYSIATSTPRILKPFLNFKFSCDIHNSHPLLFNFILHNHYSLSPSLIKRLNNLFLLLNIPPHNVSKLIRKNLINNDIKKEEIANIPNDVLAYMYLTSKGVFWNNVISEDIVGRNNLLRSDIKILMFAEVFYSKTLNTRGKFYAKLFRSQFPNVYKIIRKEKKEDRTKLANDMMRLESELFHQILMKLYNKRFKVISIHDAIVVLDIKSNEKCTVELVKKIIQEVYYKKGLTPDVSIDYYGYDYMKQALKDEEKLNIKINNYLSDLHSRSEKGDEISTLLLEDINNGKYDFYFDSNLSDIALHPIDIKNM